MKLYSNGMIASAFALLLLISIGWIVLSHDTSEVAVEPIVNHDATASVDDSVATTDAREWNEFRYYDIPLTFQYPASWSTLESEGANRISLIDPEQENPTYPSEETRAVFVDWQSADTLPNDFEFTCDYFLDSRQDNIECEIPNASGYPFFVLRNPLVAGIPDEGQLVSAIQYLDGNLYTVSFFTGYMNSIPEEERLDLAEEMLSTLFFGSDAEWTAEGDLDTSGWHEYSEPDVPVSFMHPHYWMLKRKNLYRNHSYIEPFKHDTGDHGGAYPIRVSKYSYNELDRGPLSERCDDYEIEKPGKVVVCELREVPNGEYLYTHLFNPVLVGGNVYRIVVQDNTHEYVVEISESWLKSVDVRLQNLYSKKILDSIRIKPNREDTAAEWESVEDDLGTFITSAPAENITVFTGEKISDIDYFHPSNNPFTFHTKEFVFEQMESIEKKNDPEAEYATLPTGHRAVKTVTRVEGGRIFMRYSWFDNNSRYELGLIYPHNDEEHDWFFSKEEEEKQAFIQSVREGRAPSDQQRYFDTLDTIAEKIEIAEDTENTQTYYDYYYTREYAEKYPERKNLQELISNEDDLVSFGIVEHPTNNEIVYFPTTDLIKGSVDGNVVKLYEYNFGTDSLRLLHEFNYVVGDKPVSTITEDILPTFRPLGITVDDSGAPTRFIGLIQHTDDSPGFCAEPLILPGIGGAWDGKRQLVSLSLENYTFSVHVLPDDVLKNVQESVEDCLSELDL